MKLIRVQGLGIRLEGGIVRIARLDGEQFTFLSRPERIITELTVGPNSADLFSFLPEPVDPVAQFPYKHVPENLAVLSVTTFDEWWTNTIRGEVRTKARKAEKRGVDIREIPFGEDLLRGICYIYNETPIRQGRLFPHYGATEGWARDYAGTYLEHSLFLGAFLEESLVGFAKLIFSADSSCACIIHLLSMIEHQDKAPTNALMARIVQACTARGVSRIIYGNYNYGKKSSDGLSDFKRAHGFRRVDLPRYYIPVTQWGRIALAAGLHRGFTAYVPEPVLAKYRQARTAFYMRRYRHLQLGGAGK